MSLNRLPEFVRQNYELHEWRHASAILCNEFSAEWDDIATVLNDFRVRKSHIVVGGGGKSKVAAALDGEFTARGWSEKRWRTQIVVDGSARDSPTHSVDCFRNKTAVEIEWSNKDPFFDRDLNNFRLLFDLRAISVGVIITKSNELNDVFVDLNIQSKYGSSTTWMNKLLPRIEGGGGGGCPILVFGIRKTLYDPDN